MGSLTMAHHDYLLLCLLLLTAVVAVNNAKAVDSFNVFENLQALLNIDHSRGIASLVSETFAKIKSDNNTGSDRKEGAGVLSAIFRILGIDAKKVGVVAVNAIIFVSQLITTSLLKSTSTEESGRKPQSGNPFEWMLENDEIINILTHINETNLPEKVIEHIQERSLHEETGCIQLLICRLSPFVRGMQNALNVPLNATLSGSKNILFHYFPTVEEISEQADVCERKYNFCVLT